jgi:hypothetical protein
MLNNAPVTVYAAVYWQRHRKSAIILVNDWLAAANSQATYLGFIAYFSATKLTN